MHTQKPLSPDLGKTSVGSLHYPYASSWRCFFMKTKDLVFMAMYLALFMVFDYVASIVPILKMPNGGSLGLGVVPLLIASYHLGYQKGILVGVLSVVIQDILGPLYYIDFFSLFLEYVVAFGIYGTACLFPNFKFGNLTVFSGILITNVIRFLCHWFAGVYYWGLNISGSFIYNFGYMAATTALCLVVVPLVVRNMKLKT